MSSSSTNKAATSQYAIPQSTFRRLVKEIIGPSNNVSAKALDVLQQAGEQHVLETMEAAAAVAHYNSRDTLYASDMSLVRTLLDGKHRRNATSSD